MIKPVLSGLAAAMLLVGCAAVADHRAADHTAVGGHAAPEARAYLVTDDPSAEVDAALTRAAQTGKHVMLVMGANWCHDSRILAGWLETERFAALIDAEYEVVFVNIGMPQSGDGHNIAIARRFGLEDLPGTPNLLVLTAAGDLVNGDTATTWRNAASREEDAIYEELAMLAQETGE